MVARDYLGHPVVRTESRKEILGLIGRVTKAVVADVREMLNQMNDVVGDIEVRQLSEGESEVCRSASECGAYLNRALAS